MVSVAMSAQKRITVPLFDAGSDCTIPVISLNIQGVTKLFLIDSGASISMIGMDFKNTFTFPISDDESDIKIYGAGGESLKVLRKYKVPVLGTFSDFVCVDISAIKNNMIYIFDVNIFGVIGSDFLRAHKATIDYDKKTLTITIF